MPFRITALPRAPFAHLFALSDEALLPYRARRVVAAPGLGYPCRVSLVDAQPGETVVLVHHEHQAADTPFRASHAIYVRETAEHAHPAPGEVPAMFRTRLLSLRGFDAAGMMLAADAVAGVALEPALDAMLSDPAVAYVHLHFAKPGCYAARVDRA
jgi:hypothetical protein